MILMNRKEEIYFRLPAVGQNILANAAGLGVNKRRYSSQFWSTLAGYEARTFWTPEQLHVFSEARRIETLGLAATTPFYSKLFAKLGCEWQDLVPAEAFAQLPTTTKASLREDPGAFRTRGLLASDSVTRTSGTTGASLEVARSAAAVDAQWAVWWRYRRWHGIDIGQWCALFAGRRIMRADQGSPYWRINIPGREVRFSTYHVGEDTASSYVDRLNRSRLRWIHGFSSAISNLARFIVEQDLRVESPIACVTLGAENVTPWQERLITEAFGVAPVQHYGLAESVANMSMCPHHSFHVDEDFSYLEFVERPDGATELVGTNFCNDATVLLRYETGDMITPGGDCSCGRGGRVVASIDGRGDESIKLPDGRVIGSPEDAFRSDLGIVEAQVIQASDDSLRVLYVPGPNWRSESLDSLDKSFRDFVGHEAVVRYQSVSAVPRTASGKLRLVVKE